MFQESTAEGKGGGWGQGKLAFAGGNKNLVEGEFTGGQFFQVGRNDQIFG